MDSDAQVMGETSSGRFVTHSHVRPFGLGRFGLGDWQEGPWVRGLKGWRGIGHCGLGLGRGRGFSRLGDLRIGKGKSLWIRGLKDMRGKGSED